MLLVEIIYPIAKKVINKFSTKQNLNANRKALFKANNGEFFTKRKSGSKSKSKNKNLNNIKSQRLFTANKANLK